MDENYRNYMTYILGKNKDIEDVLLPYGQRINKYDFISLASQILPFNRCPVSFIIDIFKDNFIADRSYDNEMMKLCNTVIKQTGEWIYDFDVLSDILIKISIIFENIYLNKHNEMIVYKTASYNIDHILSILEAQFKVKGIMRRDYTYIDNKTYDFDFSMSNIVDDFQKYYEDRCSTSTDLKEMSKRLEAILALENEPKIAYFEILLLVANTYNTYIKELYCNEW